MWGKMVSIIGLFIGATGQFALSMIEAPEGIWITRPDLPEHGYYKDQDAIDLWKKTQKWGHIATFIAFIFSISGIILS